MIEVVQYAPNLVLRASLDEECSTFSLFIRQVTSGEEVLMDFPWCKSHRVDAGHPVIADLPVGHPLNFPIQMLVVKMRRELRSLFTN